MLRATLTRYLLIAAILLLAANHAEAATHRVALVIGNGIYEHTSSLPNPEHDARAITAVLKTQGFEVFPHFNIDLKKMKRAIAEVANRARASGKDTVVLFYNTTQATAYRFVRAIFSYRSMQKSKTRAT